MSAHHNIAVAVLDVARGEFDVFFELLRSAALSAFLWGCARRYAQAFCAGMSFSGSGARLFFRRLAAPHKRPEALAPGAPSAFRACRRAPSAKAYPSRRGFLSDR
jgi:hypothetical protein